MTWEPCVAPKGEKRAAKRQLKGWWDNNEGRRISAWTINGRHYERMSFKIDVRKREPGSIVTTRGRVVQWYRVVSKVA